MTRPATHRMTIDGLEMDLDDNGEIVRILDHAGDGGSDAMTWAEKLIDEEQRRRRKDEERFVERLRQVVDGAMPTIATRYAGVKKSHELAADIRRDLRDAVEKFGDGPTAFTLIELNEAYGRIVVTYDAAEDCVCVGMVTLG